jgi:predicted transcriptional regulator
MFIYGLKGVCMSKYRDRLQIIANILSIASGRAKKTQIMYQANLSYKLLCRYLDEVQSAGLVSFEDEERYTLTTKGREFLSRHQEYFKRCKSLEERLSHVNGERAALEEMCTKVSNADKSSSRSDRRRN